MSPPSRVYLVEIAVSDMDYEDEIFYCVAKTADIGYMHLAAHIAGRELPCDRVDEVTHPADRRTYRASKSRCAMRTTRPRTRSSSRSNSLSPIDLTFAATHIQRLKALCAIKTFFGRWQGTVLDAKNLVMHYNQLMAATAIAITASVECFEVAAQYP